MSDILDIVRDQRPERPALDAATRDRIRSRVAGELGADATVESKPDLTRTVVRSAERDRTPRRLMAVAATVLTIAGVAGVWASSNRPGEQTPPPAQQPSEPTLSTERSVSTVPVPNGAMTLDQLPAALANATGFSYVGTPEAFEPPFPVGTWIQRWYTATMDQPERQSRLKLASAPATQQFPSQIPPDGVEAEPVTVRGATAWLYDDPASSGRTVALQNDETVFVLTGYQLSDDDLLTAAEFTTLADSGTVGAVIDPDALPAGLVERAVGTSAEDPFIPLDTLQSTPASIRWYNTRSDGSLPGDGEPMLWLGWRLEDPELFPLNRLDYDNVTDATVHGGPAFIAANDAPTYLGLLWSEGGYTYTLGGFGLDQSTVLEAANQLRPATNADWAALAPEPG